MRLLLQAELDGELDAASVAPLAAHTASCENCARLQHDLSGLSVQLRAGLTRHAAPPGLRHAILAQVPASPVRTAPRLSSRDGSWFAAGLAVAASVAALMILPRGSDKATELVAAHIRALQPGHLLDVESTDRHTVKPWFDGKLDFAPPVSDFAAQGYRLVGGRLDYLEGRPVAALVYQRDKHLIDLFVWPGNQPEARRTVQGYNLTAWSRHAMNFRAVSDLNEAELAVLKRLLIEAE